MNSTARAALFAGVLLALAGLSCAGWPGRSCRLQLEVIDERRSATTTPSDEPRVLDAWTIGLDAVESAAIVPTPGLPNFELRFAPSVTERIVHASIRFPGEYLSISRPGFEPLQLHMVTSLEGTDSFNIPVGSEAHGAKLREMFTAPCRDD